MKLDLKTIVTLVMTIGLVVFTFLKIIDSTLFVSTCGAVFAYYFNKDLKAEVKQDENKSTDL